MKPGAHWTELDTPTLLVDLDRLERNIRHMAALAGRHSLALRPHAKTHKSLAIAERQMAAGARGLTVAKLGEAETFAAEGFNDIFVANQLVTDAKLDRAARLIRDGARLTFGVDSAEGVSTAARVARRCGVTFTLLIEIDSGLHRCGVAPPAAVELAQALDDEPGVAFAGVFTHAGHAYAARFTQDLERAAEEEAGAVVEAAQAIGRIGLEAEVVSVGSTPTAERVAAQPGITELRPGNYVFYDGMQVSLGVAGSADCSLSVAATVISRPAPDRAVIDAGAKTLGLDRGAHGVGALPDYGRLLDEEGALVRLSEEHGVLEVPPESRLGPGDRVRVLPNHACAVANLADGYAALRDDELVEWWPVDARGAVR